MSLLHKTDVYPNLNEEAASRYPEYGFALALICVALVLVAASVLSPALSDPAANFHSSVRNDPAHNAMRARRNFRQIALLLRNAGPTDLW